MSNRKELELEIQLMQVKIELIRAQGVILSNDFNAFSARQREIEEQLIKLDEEEKKEEENKEEKGKENKEPEKDKAK